MSDSTNQHSTWQRIWHWPIEALFPKKCLGCGKLGRWCCRACFASITFPRQLHCPNCGTATNLGQFCESCQGERCLAGVWVTQNYGNPLIKNLIRALKYDGIIELAGPLGQILATTLKTYSLPPNWHNIPRADWYLTPVPLGWSRLRQRNFNQAENLAEEVNKITKLNIAKVLERSCNTKPQSDLETEARLQNLKNAFRLILNYDVRGKAYIIVDDVYTSGATLEECARVLRHNGASAVWGLVVAKGG